ncbi:hypothetical protein [Aminobacter sp. BE322]|uniref:glycine-rich domain-containing protein n=1 Tax=unclassified Aminobacter TaxID=2644704 RepID=UPI003D2278F4
MANRKLPNSLSTPPVGGMAYMDAVSSKVDMLFDAISLKPISMTNAGNDYTITVDPVLDADVVAGMSFFIRPSASNTGPCRLRVTSDNPYYDLVKATGETLGSGDFASGTAYFVVFMDGEFRILSVANSEGGNGASAYFQEFLVSGTWTKPAELSPNALVIVEVWGGGGGGGTGSNNRGGGGGGAYNSARFKASDLPSSVAVTVGAGGAAASVGGVGGNSSFGSYVTAYGGGGGHSGNTSSAGGGGGGATSAGGNGANGAGGHGGTGAIPTAGLIATSGFGSGTPGSGRYGGGGSDSSGGSAIWGGGGGGSISGSGGGSVFGGGGGGGSAGGASLFGGNGGGAGVAGSVPGGGGGTGAGGNGAAGKAIVRIVG